MDHLIDDEELPHHERELTLSTGSILAIFLGLVVLCGAFFGFGYNMGRKSAPTPLSLSDVAPAAEQPSASPVTTVSKPAAGSLADEGANARAAEPPQRPVRRTPPPSAAATEEAATNSEPTTKPAPAKPAAAAPAPIVRQPAPVPAPSLASTAGPGGSSYMVQVAAVSHQEDAQLLIGALRARGYAVAARSTPGDSFIHVQVGPFRDKKEADAMRQRLLTDGYNAIVKQ